MKHIKENWFKLNLLIVILLTGIVLGMFYYINETKKQTELKLQAETAAKLDAENKIKELTAQKIIEAKKAETLKNNRISKADECVKKAETTAVNNAYIECVSNPAVGGSEEKCPMTDTEQTIRYIRSQNIISFEMWRIDKQLTKDLETCVALYGR